MGICEKKQAKQARAMARYGTFLQAENDRKTMAAAAAATGNNIKNVENDQNTLGGGSLGDTSMSMSSTRKSAGRSTATPQTGRETAIPFSSRRSSIAMDYSGDRDLLLKNPSISSKHMLPKQGNSKTNLLQQLNRGPSSVESTSAQSSPAEQGRSPGRNSRILNNRSSTLMSRSTASRSSSRDRGGHRPSLSNKGIISRSSSIDGGRQMNMGRRNSQVFDRSDDLRRTISSQQRGPADMPARGSILTSRSRDFQDTRRGGAAPSSRASSRASRPSSRTSSGSSYTSRSVSSSTLSEDEASSARPSRQRSGGGIATASSTNAANRNSTNSSMMVKRPSRSIVRQTSTNSSTNTQRNSTTPNFGTTSDIAKRSSITRGRDSSARVSTSLEPGRRASATARASLARGMGSLW
ncbi:unnamed protein product [Amoebophrya sp. A25]|nr:unnamed protein product [Amoebophrya sp. A25]|eukprot:GSA25T00006833001.1